MCDSLRLVDFVLRLVDSVFHLLDVQPGKVIWRKYFEEIQDAEALEEMKFYGNVQCILRVHFTLSILYNSSCN